MAEYRKIEIDIEVHKRIEIEKRAFSESENSVLRRLLGIDLSESIAPSRGRPWSGKGVTLPHGTQVKMEYNGRHHAGRIDEGQWLVEGQAFSSPSAAAGGVALTKAGTHPSLDGWLYWRIKLPGQEKWTPLKELRD